DGRPVRRRVRGQSAVNGIYSEREELIESRVVRLQPQRGAQQVPIKGFQVPEIKDQPVALRDGAIVEGIRRKQFKQRVRARSRLLHAGQQGRLKFRRYSVGRHKSPLRGVLFLLRPGVSGQANLLQFT